MSKKATKQTTKQTTKRNVFAVAWKNLAQTLVALVFILVVWAVAYAAVGNDLLVPSVGDCLKEMGRLLTDGGFWAAFLHTFLLTGNR